MEASVFAESILMDKETGRIFWEASGHLSTVSKSIWHKLGRVLLLPQQYQTATVLSLLYFLGWLGCLRPHLPQQRPFGSTSMLLDHVDGMSPRPPALAPPFRLRHSWNHYEYHELPWFVVTLLTRLVRNVLFGLIPQFDTWLVVTFMMLYLWEAYTCPTRHYVRHALTTPDQVEDYLEQLRQQPPSVIWKLRAFHYEPSWLGRSLDTLRNLPLCLPSFRPQLGHPNEEESTTKASATNHQKKNILTQIVAAFRQRNHNDSPEQEEQQIANGDDYNVRKTMLTTRPLLRWLLWRKRVTKQVEGSYQFADWVDGTVVGVWNKRVAQHSKAAATTKKTTAAPMAKLRLSQLLVLSNAQARRDYVQQQANFLAQHVNDDSGDDDEEEEAEFTTVCTVPGLEPRILAVRGSFVPPKKQTTAMHFLNLEWQFWIWTLLGLTVPYRIRLANRCDEIRVTVVKETLDTKKAIPIEKSPFPSTSLTARTYWDHRRFGFLSSSSLWWRNRPRAATKQDFHRDKVFQETMRRLELYKKQVSAEVAMVEDDQTNSSTKPETATTQQPKLLVDKSPKPAVVQDGDNDNKNEKVHESTTESDTTKLKRQNLKREEEEADNNHGKNERNLILQELQEAVESIELVNDAVMKGDTHPRNDLGGSTKSQNDDDDMLSLRTSDEKEDTRPIH
ncbi:hypothetical protein ACA910_018081 [Epithemia clementina (nom. ined.)]